MARLDDLIMPNPQVFPACSACSAPYALRRGHGFDGKRWTETWAWFRDCEKECKRKNKKAEAKMVDLRRRRTPRAVKEVEKAAAAAGLALEPLGERHQTRTRVRKNASTRGGS